MATQPPYSPVRAELPPSQLSAETLRQLQSMFMDYGWRNQQKSLGNGGLEYLDPASGMYYIPQFQTVSTSESEPPRETLAGFTAYDSNNPLWKQAFDKKDNFYAEGAPMLNYGADGSFRGETAFTGAHKNSVMDQLLPLGMMALPFALTAMGVAGAGAGAAGAGGVGAEGMVNGAFLGEGMASGVPLWDAAAMNAGLSLTSPAAALPSLTDVPSDWFPGEAPWSPTPNASPLNFGPTDVPSDWFPGEAPWSPTPGSTPLDFPPIAPPGGPAGSSILDKVLSNPGKLLAPLTGGLLGSQSSGGAGAGRGSGNELDERAAPYIYDEGGLFPRAAGLLNDQMPQAQRAGQQMISAGTGLLSQPVAGNGFSSVPRFDQGNAFSAVERFDPGNLTGTVQMERPDYSTNPYIKGILDDAARRSQDFLGRSLNQIRGNAVGVGGVGGSREGVAQAEAIRGVGDDFMGRTYGFLGQQYDADMNRSLGKYNTDVGFAGQQRGQDLQRTGLEFGFANQQRGMDLQRQAQEFDLFSNQRQQDLQQATVGAGLLGSGQESAWGPIKNASSTYAPFSGLSSAAGQRNGFNWSGFAGGLLGGANFANEMGWFKN